ncbi:MAG: peptidoglycan-binding protein [Bradyrhizobium sp.]|nr:peptidoglycan-binding protein [Bradyrhizobium sp.]
MLTTSMLAAPAAFAASNNYNKQQPAQGQQTQQMQKGQPQNQQNGQGRQNQQNAQSKQQNGQQQSAENTQPISPESMSRGNVKQVQQALDQQGFKAGRADGRWGRETASAVKQFQQSKQLQPTGRLDEQTVADLGLDSSKFPQPQNQ